MKVRLDSFNKVGTRLMIAFVAVAILPVLLVGWYAQNQSEEALIKQTLRKHEQKASTAAEQVKRYLDGSISDVMFLARSHLLTKYLNAVVAEDSVTLEDSRYALEQEFLEFSNSRGNFYYSLRYIDENGDETIRVNQKDSGNIIVPRNRLKNEGKDGYFKDTMKMSRGELYVSHLNLNREQGKAVVPYQPVLRYATPVFYNDGRRAGIVIANVSAIPMLESLGNTLLVSEDGFYLNHPQEEKRWGAPHDLATGISFVQEHNARWAAMQQETGGSKLDKGEGTLAAFNQVRVPGTNRNWWVVEESNAKEALASVSNFNKVFIMIGLLGLMVSMGIAVFTGRSITGPLSKLTSVVRKVAAGDQNARAMIRGGGEFEDLGNAFDQMVDERIATMVKMEMENEALNNSIIELMEATAKLSENDLSIHVPVREDITGVVADGLNKMIKGTNEVLQRIQTVADEVKEATIKVKERSDAVVEVAQEERQIVEETLRSLDASAQAMQGVADLAQICSQTAEQASGTTRKALETVTGTVTGMNEIREIISETEKRIKRLGERSQEINSVVEIINNIAERTHVLALNASMQAAAAGEAGRGFAVVADEVQRLAENSRNSTSQIAALVHNIQTETSETMATMNKTISQVVNGSELAELAGRQMRETEQTTSELVQAVMKISDQSVAQSIAINELRRDAAGIRRSTQVTGQQLQEQAEQTDFLVTYAASLQDAVQVFQLKSEG